LTLLYRCTISTCSGRGAGSVVVFWFDMLQQMCSRWQTRDQDVAFFHRCRAFIHHKSQNPTLFCSFIGHEIQLYGNSSVPAQDSLRLLLPPRMRLQINQIHALKQQQPAALMFHLPSRGTLPPSLPLKIAYFSLQFSPRNSLNGLASGIFRSSHPAAFRKSFCFLPP
jgi:hypothetical protein